MRIAVRQAAARLSAFASPGRPRPGRASRAVLRLAGLVVLIGLPALAACGKKGPPLPPLQTVPGRIEDLAVSRRGEEVRMRLTVPSVASDGKPMTNLSAVEVYGLSGKPEGPTGAPLTPDEIFKYATLVGHAEVKPPPKELTPEEQEKAESGLPKPPEPEDSRPGIGDVVTMREAITPELMTPWVHPKKKQVEKKEVPEGTPLWWPGPSEDLTRMYVAVGVNRKGKRGALSNRVSLPLVNPPQPPAAPTLTFNQSAIVVTWTEAPGAYRPMQQTPPPADELPSKPIVTGASPTKYLVYQATRRQAGSTTAAAPASTTTTVMKAGQVVKAAGAAEHTDTVTSNGVEYVLAPTPLNPTATTALTYSDGRLAFGQERCYVVRAIQQFDAATVESLPSPVACITPADQFPPEAPKNLVAVANETGVSLIWEANTEPDLGGYIVLRGEAPADPAAAPAFATLTPSPITETTYRDATAKPGVRYVYAVIAIDRATPPNKSAESNHVEATVR